LPDYTTVGLLANTKRRTAVGSGSGLTTSELLEVLSEQLRTYIPAFLKGLREEFIIAELNITVTSPVVPLPPRACGAAFRTIGWLHPDGRVEQLTRIEPERRNDWGENGDHPTGFMFQGNNAILIPAVQTGTLVVSYQERPGQLVLPTSCALVTGYDDSSSLIVSNLPTGIATDAPCDIVSATPNFVMFAMDAVVLSTTNLGGGEWKIEFDDTLPTNIQPGDYVSLAGETCIPRLPMEAFDLLAQAAAFQIASNSGNERLPAYANALKMVREQVALVLSPRADGSSRIITTNSRLGRRYW
jgi:hypothetical protein